jgi:hypothetical protein
MAGPRPQVAGIVGSIGAIPVAARRRPSLRAGGTAAVGAQCRTCIGPGDASKSGEYPVYQNERSTRIARVSPPGRLVSPRFAV